MLNGITETEIDHFGCFLHTLHLIVRSAVFVQPGLENLIAKLKEIVKFYRKSPKEKALFASEEVE